MLISSSSKCVSRHINFRTCDVQIQNAITQSRLLRVHSKVNITGCSKNGAITNLNKNCNNKITAIVISMESKLRPGPDAIKLGQKIQPIIGWTWSNYLMWAKAQQHRFNVQVIFVASFRNTCSYASLMCLLLSYIIFYSLLVLLAPNWEKEAEWTFQQLKNNLIITSVKFDLFVGTNIFDYFKVRRLKKLRFFFPIFSF